MNAYAKQFAAVIQGADLDSAYAKAFGGVVVDGIRDGGRDVLTGDEKVPYVQVKGSKEGLMKFLADSLRFKRFIPVCVGEPGKKAEMLKSLLEHGIWIGSDIPNSQEIRSGVAAVRKMICCA